ncbi:MAG: MaoC family dehydratase [Thaumarchaeota archaeon]|nr:MaoC family dehydratase [Nitrososphaerota archaeon]
MSQPQEVQDSGRFFEDFETGQFLKHELGRTITDNDNISFTLMTCNSNPIHFNQDYCEKNFPGPPFNGRMLVNAALIFAVVAGLSVADTSKNGVMLGMTDLKVTNPVFAGDTLYSESSILSKRESKSREGMGIVTIKTRGYKQDGTTVMEFERTFLTRKRGQVWKG